MKLTLAQRVLDRSYLGRASALVEQHNNAGVLILESGVVGGDMLPRKAMEPTRKELQKIMTKIADATGDSVEVQFVGSTSYGAGGAINKAFFGDIDVVLRMGKTETLSKIKQWAIDNAQNVRDIKSRKHGPDLDVDALGDQFSFLFPMYKDNGEKVTIGELRFAMETRMGETTWKTNHDERLKIQSNLENLKDKNGIAMVQIDIIRSLVDGQEIQRMMEKAKALATRLETLSRGETSDIDTFREYHAWLGKYLDSGELEDFDSHYKWMKNHGELQSVEDQRMLTALYYLSSQEKAKQGIGNRVKSTAFRYSFHPDALQMIHYLAAQLGERLEDDDFTKANLNGLIQRAEKVGILREPKMQRADGTQLPPAEVKRLTVDMLRDPTALNDALGFFAGKHKESVRRAIASGTKHKRANESNPNALFRNYGTRNILKV